MMHGNMNVKKNGYTALLCCIRILDSSTRQQRQAQVVQMEFLRSMVG
jgi:hypothetical protein